MTGNRLLPRQASLRVADGTLEALKYLALVAMTLDHVNKYLFHAGLPYLTELGRLAMPIFGFVLAYNLARPDAVGSGAHARVMRRLLTYGILASVFYIPLVGWKALNIMFMLWLAAYLIGLIEHPRPKGTLLACLAFLIGGACVEYWWFGLAYCLTAWRYCKSPGPIPALLWAGATATLWYANGSQWAMAALPILLLAPHLDMAVPRIRHLFYAYYPAHLAVLLGIRTDLQD